MGNKLIHIAKIYEGRGNHYLFLRETAKGFRWFAGDLESREKATDVIAPSANEAMHMGAKEWAGSSFEPLHCGFRYDLTQRDEHGINAYFCQMVSSYQSPEFDWGYHDAEAGHRCYVDFASEEALDLWHKLSAKGRLDPTQTPPSSPRPSGQSGQKHPKQK